MDCGTVYRTPPDGISGMPVEPSAAAALGALLLAFTPVEPCPAEALLAPLSACVVEFCSAEAMPAPSPAVCRIYSAANFPARPASSET